MRYYVQLCYYDVLFHYTCGSVWVYEYLSTKLLGNVNTLTLVKLITNIMD